MFLFYLLFLIFIQLASHINGGMAQVITNKQYTFFDLNKFNNEIKNNYEEEKNDVNLLNINPKEISAKSFLVKEIDGKTLLAKNQTVKMPVASLTKLLSAYLANSLYSPTTTFIFTLNSINQLGDVGNFRVGEEIKRDDALKASLIASSNDAIFLLAENYGLEKFIDLMNKKAKEIDMINSQFHEPTGISSKNISTALDLYHLTKKIYSNNSEIFSWTILEKVNVNGKLLWTTNILFPYYKNIIVGAKTGFTDDAGECLLLLVKFNNSPFVNIVILNSKDRFADAKKIIDSLKNYYGN